MKGRFVLALLLSYNTLLAQQPYALPQVTPKSPNVASMEKYGNVPASLNNGIPNISIPLTSITVDNLNIPITLSYHNNGLKVEEIPSMIGLGWDLSFGGMISYNQRGINDFNIPYGMQTTYPNVRNYLNGSSNDSQRFVLMENIINSQQDDDFDSYTLNFLGHSGLFYFDTTGQAVVSPKSDLRVYKMDTGLKVIDNSGNQFIFQDAEGASSYDAATLYIYPTFSDISAWYLSRIITKNNNEIRFKYKAYQVQYAKTSQLLTYYTDNCATSSVDYADILTTLTYLLPDSIIFNQGFVKFNLSNSPREDLLQSPIYDSVPSLAGFYVVNNHGRKVSEFDFNQGYFGTNARLKLTSIEEKSLSQIGRKWKFNYYGESSAFPAFNDKGKDHWGYYNGATNSTLIPEANYRRDVFGTWYYFLGGNYANRRSNFNYSKIGMLQTITYPTGGSSSFNYEPNQVKVKNPSDIIGNAFLKWTSALPTMAVTIASGNTNYTGTTSGSFTITDSTVVYLTAYSQEDYPSQMNSASVGFTGPTGSVAELYSTYYQTLTNYYKQGFGEVVLEPGTYNWSVYQGYNYDANMPLQSTFEITTQVLDSSGALPPFQLSGGRISSIISYDSIAHIRTSSKKYIYSDSLNAVIFRNIPWYASTRYYGWNPPGTFACVACGTESKVTDESVRPFTGSNIEYLKVTEYEDTSGIGGKTEYTFLPSSDEGGNYSKPYIPAVNTFWRSGNIISEKVYKYDTGQYTLIRQIDNGYYIGTKEKYANGIKVDYSTWSPIQTGPCREHVVGLSTSFTEMFYQNGSATRDILNDTITNITNISATSSNHTLPTLIEKFDSEGYSLKEKTTYSFDYDTTNVLSPESIAIRDLMRKNILVPIEKIQIKAIHDTDYVVASTLYTYKPDKAVIDRIYALKVSSPFLATAFTESSINGSGSFIKDSRYETRIIENKYDPYNNIVEQQKASDLRTTYIWDYNHTYPVAEIVNADSGEVAYTSFEADGNGDWIIGSSSRDTTNSIMGRSAYQLSNGNLTKSGLNSSTDYQLSYWTKNNTPFTITGTQGIPQQGKTIAGWTCFVHKIKSVTQVTLSGTGLVDEIKLCPLAAQMTTYTYDPMVGLTGVCNPRNAIVYYQYDGFNRLSLIRDQEGNILKSYQYKYQEQQ